jgi:metallo-beta-lactamase class B
MTKTTFLLAVCLGLVALQPGFLLAQDNEQWRSWNQPVEPFRLISNVYYVGANEIAAYLITSSEGHILIDGGFPETAAIIQANVARLGFQIEDVEILLNSHAHFDHAGGLAELKRRSGAQLFVSNGDADLVENGGKDDFLLGDTGLFPPVSVDRRLADGDVVRLGEVALTAHLTAGHTRGCTTWTMTVEEGGKSYEAVFVCSVTLLPGVRLLDEPSYPGIAEDFARTFEVLKALPCDVFLAPHGSFFVLADKIEALAENPAVNPFVDPARYRAYVERGERRFRERLAEERKEAGGGEP